MMDYAPLLVLVPLAAIVLYLVDYYWDETEGLFTLTYLLAILSILIGWTMTDILDINIFLP
jgi:hypothetical protein